MGHRSDNTECLFAIEVEPTPSDLSENIAVYRSLSPGQKAKIAAELRRLVAIEIAEEPRVSRRRHATLPKTDNAVRGLMRALASFVVFNHARIQPLRTFRAHILAHRVDAR